MSAKDTIVTLVIGARDNASKALGRFEKSLGGVKAKVAAVGATIATYFGARAIGRFFGSAITDAATFEEQMDKVAAVSGATAEELDLLKAAAKKMGAETSYTATESAQALELLARAGLSANDSISTLPVVLDLAKGSGLELAEAASQITSTTSAMGYGFDQAARVADVLTKTAASANTNVQQLGRAMSYAGPVAASLGLEVEDVAAIIGKFSDAGIRGERAGTALRAVLAQMSDPASKASQALRDLGIATDDPIEAIKELAKAGPAGKAAIRAFGLEAGPSLQALLNQGTAGLVDLRNKLDDAAGSSANAAAIMADNVPGALKGLGSVWDSIKQKLATPLLEPIKIEILDLTARLREFSNSEEIQRFAESLVTGFKNVSASVKEFLAGFDFKEAIRSTGEFVENLSQNLSIAGNTLTVIGQSIRVFINGFTAGVRTIGAAVTGYLSAVTQASAKLLDFFGADEMSQRASLIAESLRDTSNAFRDAVVEDSNDMKDALDKVVGAMSDSGEAYASTAQAAEESTGRQAAAAQQAADAVDGVKTEVRELKEELETPIDDSRLQEAVAAVSESAKRLGIDIEQALGKTTTATRNALTDVKALATGMKDAGYTTVEQSAVMKAALEKAFAGAKTKEDINAINATLREMGAQGLLTGEQIAQLADTYADAMQRMQGSTDGANESLQQQLRDTEEWRRVMQEINDLHGVTGDQIEVAGDQVEVAGDQIEVAGEQAGEAGDQLQRMGRHGHDAAGNIAQINAVAHRAGLALSDVAKYAKELNQQIAEATSEIEGRMTLKAYFRRLHDVEFQAGETARALMYLDGRMERLNANSSDAARGVADLEMRLMELTASEDEIARARAERDKNELKIQIEKNRLEAERARVLGNNDEAQRLESENALLQKQIDLLSQIHHEEKKQRDRERAQERGDQGDTPTTSRTTPEPQTIKVVEHRFGDKRVRVVEDDSDDLLDLLDRQRQSSY